MSRFKLALAVLACVVIGYAYGPSARAQATMPIFPAPPCVNVDLPIALKAADGTTTTTTVTIDCNAAWAFWWQHLQDIQNAQTMLNLTQYAAPICLVAGGGDQHINWDRTANKLRDFSGALYSVSSSGVPYRNAQRMGSTSNFQKLCLYGNEAFGKGTSGGAWAVWNQDKGTWTALPSNSIDQTVLN